MPATTLPFGVAANGTCVAWQWYCDGNEKVQCRPAGVNFFTRNPAQKNNFHSVASLTPEYTEFQVGVKPPPQQ